MAFNWNPYTIPGTLNLGPTPQMGDYQGAYANAQSINKQLYENQSVGWKGLTESVLGNLAGVGDQEKTRINTDYADRDKKVLSQAINQGLGNFTIQHALRSRVKTDRDYAQNDLSSKIGDLYARHQSDLGRGQLGWMNSIRADYPDMDQYARYEQMKGQLGAAGQGFGGGGLPQEGQGGAPRYPDRGQGSRSSPQSPFSPSRPYAYGSGDRLTGGFGGMFTLPSPYQQAGVDLYGGGIDAYGNPLYPTSENEHLRYNQGDYDYGGDPLWPDEYDYGGDPLWPDE